MTLREKFRKYWRARYDPNIGLVENSIKQQAAWSAYQAGHAEGVKETARRCGIVAEEDTNTSSTAYNAGRKAVASAIRAEYPEAF